MATWVQHISNNEGRASKQLVYRIYPVFSGVGGGGASRVKSPQRDLAADNHDAIQPTSPQFVNLESAVMGKTKTTQQINQQQRLPEVGNGLWLV